ncbi:MAG: DUF370 domain-containing protein [Negativibacillus sp.]|nr:DUF370 domain-containing protein [Negativibacillus sp.]
MYLHLGQDIVVRSSDIIGIFDIENTSVSKSTKEYLGEQEKRRRVVNVSTELPKSFIVCSDEKNRGEIVVYISQISCATLKKRSGYVDRLGLAE